MHFHLLMKPTVLKGIRRPIFTPSSGFMLAFPHSRTRMCSSTLFFFSAVLSSFSRSVQKFRIRGRYILQSLLHAFVLSRPPTNPHRVTAEVGTSSNNAFSYVEFLNLFPHSFKLWSRRVCCGRIGSAIFSVACLMTQPRALSEQIGARWMTL